MIKPQDVITVEANQIISNPSSAHTLRTNSGLCGATQDKTPPLALIKPGTQTISHLILPACEATGHNDVNIDEQSQESPLILSGTTPAINDESEDKFLSLPKETSGEQSVDEDTQSIDQQKHSVDLAVQSVDTDAQSANQNEQCADQHKQSVDEDVRSIGNIETLC